MIDGEVTFFRIQHRPLAHGRLLSGLWAASDLYEFLGRNLTPAQKRGAEGERVRAMIERQGAGTALWQTHGIHGYEREEDARPVLYELRERNEPDKYEFRLVKITMTQVTELVA